MGFECSLVNHRDRTMFELGKSFSSGFQVEGWAKDEASILEAVIDSVPDYRENWDDEYTEVIFERIKTFVGRTPNDQIEIVNDSDGSEHNYLCNEFYTPVGSRYGMTDEEEQEWVAHRLEWQEKARALYEISVDKENKAKQIAKQVVWHLTRGVYKQESSEQTKRAIEVATRIIRNHV